MDEVNRGFQGYRQKRDLMDLGVNFEDRVFQKIRKKKKERKIVAATGIGLLLGGFLFLASGLLQQKADFSKPGLNGPMIGQTGIKEENPVMGEVLFATSDSQTNYAIENVAYNDDHSI